MPHFETPIRTAGRTTIGTHFPWLGREYPFKLRTVPIADDPDGLGFEVVARETPALGSVTLLGRQRSWVRYIPADTNNSEHAEAGMMVWGQLSADEELRAVEVSTGLAAFNRYLGECGIRGVYPRRDVHPDRRPGSFVAQVQLEDCQVVIHGQTRTLETARLVAAGLDLVIAHALAEPLRTDT